MAFLLLWLAWEYEKCSIIRTSFPSKNLEGYLKFLLPLSSCGFHSCFVWFMNCFTVTIMLNFSATFSSSSSQTGDLRETSKFHTPPHAHNWIQVELVRFVVFIYPHTNQKLLKAFHLGSMWSVPWKLQKVLWTVPRAHETCPSVPALLSLPFPHLPSPQRIWSCLLN